MANLHNASLSPRIVNGVWLWYEGDTFEFNLELELEDQDGIPVNIESADSVDIKFRNDSGENVKDFAFTGVRNNIVTMVFDDACSAKFPKGKYTYDVRIKHKNITTVARNNKVVVE